MTLITDDNLLQRLKNTLLLDSLSDEDRRNWKEFLHCVNDEEAEKILAFVEQEADVIFLTKYLRYHLNILRSGDTTVLEEIIEKQTYIESFKKIDMIGK
jgi:hypothetical protein